MGKKQRTETDTFDNFDIEDIESSYTDTDLFNPEEIISKLESKDGGDSKAKGSKHLSALRRIEDMMDERQLEDSLRDLFDDDPNALIPE